MELIVEHLTKERDVDGIRPLRNRINNYINRIFADSWQCGKRPCGVDLRLLLKRASQQIRVVYYSHNNINHNSNTNTHTITGGLFRFGYERVYQFLASVHGDTGREIQFLKAYANHAMLTPPQCAAQLVMFKISIHLCRSRSEKFNRSPQR